MLYPENNTEKLSIELFKNPTSNYRSAPFWGWNSKLDDNELLWQIEIMKSMGFGGFHMHARTGLATTYLSDEFIEKVKLCVRKAKAENMFVWLYDEDRWPSGAAGGLVTKDINNRAKHLLFTTKPYGSVGEMKPAEKVMSTVKAVRTENGHLLACYDIQLDDEGYLLGWKRIDEDEEARGKKWYAYLERNFGSPWYNDQDYINALDRNAVNQFIAYTHERYSQAVGEAFGETIPAIFTDEPQIPRMETLQFAKSEADIMLPWTEDLEVSYDMAYPDEKLMDNLPELFWERADGKPSLIRYHYHDHICERFTEIFIDRCAKWCDEHGLALTGHMIAKGTLHQQAYTIGDAMRPLRKMQLPGIDMLCAEMEYISAKQVQSVVHQYGREGMLSELYGVTGWNFDFRDYKLHGDWQAALGVTVRVHASALMSLEGESKRDYPGSINYQSPWWKKYHILEDYFARINTALTRGKSIVRVGVIHPIESYWLHWGPNNLTGQVRQTMENELRMLVQWLLFGGIDFDFISESLLPGLCKKAENPMRVGDMAYDLILVPGCETLRSSTLARLEDFADAGGRLVFVGKLPAFVDAHSSDRGIKLAQKARCIRLLQEEVLEVVAPFRCIEVRNKNGKLCDNLLHQIRKDGDGSWLFLAHGKEPLSKEASGCQALEICIDGMWKPELYQALTGEIDEVTYRFDNNKTVIDCAVYDYDSLLFWLEPADPGQGKVHCVSRSASKEEQPEKLIEKTLPEKVSYTLDEPNVLLLDYAQYALDDAPWEPEEEILRLDEICRKTFRWKSRANHVVQPYVLEDEKVVHKLRLKWHIQSEIVCEGAKLAIENAGDLRIRWNGVLIDNQPSGWYMDKAIQTVDLPIINKGENVLEAELPFGRKIGAEWAYILGNFGVKLCGHRACITEVADKLAFGDITSQGFPFYGGNITYHIPVQTNGGNLRVVSGHYRGGLQEVSIDGKTKPIIFPPYKADFTELKSGQHRIDLVLYGHRHNGFGPLHLADKNEKWIGPDAWRTEGDLWCREYQLDEIGVMALPRLFEY